MPRKLKQKPYGSPTLKSKRGRPKKSVSPEALDPFEIPKCVAVVSDGLKEERLPSGKSANRHSNPATSDRFYSADEVEFMNALAEFKRASGKKFPTCSEILDVLRSLGYEKCAT